MVVSHPRTVAAIAGTMVVLAAAAGGNALTDGSSARYEGTPVAVTRGTLPGALDSLLNGSPADATLPNSTFALPPPVAAPAAGPVAPPTLVRVSVPASTLAANGVPTAALRAYKRAATLAATRTPGCHIPWPLVAAIGRVESDHGRFADNVLHADGVSTPGIVGIPLDGNGTEVVRDTDGGKVDGDRTYDRAVGPMQFIPSTWARWRTDADRDGKADVNDIDDAAAATAAYLCANDRNLATYAGQRKAVLSYNHSSAYLTSVLALEKVYARGVTTVRTAPGKGDASKPRRAEPAVPTAAPTAPTRPGTSAKPRPTSPSASMSKPPTSRPTSKPPTSKPPTSPKPTPTCTTPTATPSASPSATPSPTGTTCPGIVTSSAAPSRSAAAAAGSAATPSASPTN